MPNENKVRKLEKWEIGALKQSLKQPTSERWLECPFAFDYLGEYYYPIATEHCTEICSVLFPKCRYSDGCPRECDKPLYTEAYVSRKVRALLRSQGVEL